MSLNSLRQPNCCIPPLVDGGDGNAHESEVSNGDVLGCGDDDGGGGVAPVVVVAAASDTVDFLDLSE